MLHEPPAHVQTRDRLRECRECNSLDRAHVCPYPQPLALRPGAQKQRAAGSPQQPRPAAPPVSGAAPAGVAAAGPPSRARASASPAAGARPSASAPDMCRSWRKTKTCPRMQRGERCPHAHPSDHVRWHCFEFAQKGSCTCRGGCSYPHIAGDQLQQQQQQQQQQRPAVAPPVAPPSSEQQQADGAAAMDVSDDGGAPAPTASAASAAAAPAPAAASSSAPATAAAQSRAAAPSMSTSNSFAALQEHDVDRVASKPPLAAPATPQRSSSRAAAAPAAPPSSLSALASPATHTSAASTNKRKADGDTTPRDPKSRRNLSHTLSATSASTASSSSAAADAVGGSKSWNQQSRRR